MSIERKRYIVMRNNRTEIWAGTAKNYHFRKLNDIDRVNIVTYFSEQKAIASCSSCDKDYEVVPVTEILEIDSDNIKTHVKINERFEQMIISAERYAFGRRSYIVGYTIDYILSLLPSLSDWCINILYSDIKSQFDTAERIKDYRHFGDNCDLKDWRRFYKALLNEIMKRQIGKENISE